MAAVLAPGNLQDPDVNLVLVCPRLECVRVNPKCVLLQSDLQLFSITCLLLVYLIKGGS